MEIVQLRRCILGLALAATVSPPAVGAQELEEPPWRTHLVLWEMRAKERHPWRNDARLAPYAAPGYPDDFQVRFANPDSAQGGEHEAMWVRAIAADSASGLFLGVLLNEPRALRSVAFGDNVVFRVAAGGLPTAAGAPNYGEAGWPASLTPA